MYNHYLDGSSFALLEPEPQSQHQPAQNHQGQHHGANQPRHSNQHHPGTPHPGNQHRPPEPPRS